MDDADLRRRLIREHLTELVLMSVAVAATVYFVAPLFSSALQSGTITLNAGSRWAPMPVTLDLRILPLAVVGFLLIFAAFVGAVAQLIVKPAYHVVRLSFPQWQLPRVPRWKMLRLISSVHFATLALIAGTGVLLVSVQYIAILAT